MHSNTLQTGFLLNGISYSYKIERVLGQGSFGITYLASVKMKGTLGAIDTNIEVAIKEFFMRDINGRSDNSVTSGSNSGIYDEYKRKFMREAINLSKLKHPNIIKVIESFEANNTIYYAMEYIDGGSLDDYIKKNHGLKEDEAITIIKQISSALSFMHNNKMLHLDLKPSNIMMKKSGNIVLIDFGLSKQYNSKGEPESSTKVGAGTPGYAPIEQANYCEGKEFPVTMDVYALGATMFKMLTGMRPPESSDILNYGFPLYELQTHKVSNALSVCITKAMAPTKKTRYQSVNDFIKALENNDEDTIIDVDVAVKRDKEQKSKYENVSVVPSDTTKEACDSLPLSSILERTYYGPKRNDGLRKTNTALKSLSQKQKKRKHILLFLCVALLALFLFVSNCFLLSTKPHLLVSTTHSRTNTTRTDSVIENIGQRDDVSDLTPANRQCPKKEPKKVPTNRTEKKSHAPKNDESRYQEAVSTNNRVIIKELATKGYTKAFSLAANIYLIEGSYSHADNYARRALSSGYGKKEAINVIEILDGYGYYDNGEHGGKPKY